MPTTAAESDTSFLRVWESKHRVCPPLVLFTATYLWYIERMQWLINTVELQAQTLKKDVSDSAAVVGIDYTSLSRL
jgi:hypothetical protein